MTPSSRPTRRALDPRAESGGGVVDKFAGDAVMATFSVADDGLDHCTRAVQVALAIRDKATLTDLAVDVGVAVGPAVVDRLPGPDANLGVLGQNNNLAARMQVAAAAGEVLLSADAFGRAADWLSQRGLAAPARTLQLKGIDGPVTAHVLGVPQ